MGIANLCFLWRPSSSIFTAFGCTWRLLISLSLHSWKYNMSLFWRQGNTSKIATILFPLILPYLLQVDRLDSLRWLYNPGWLESACLRPSLVHCILPRLRDGYGAKALHQSVLLCKECCHFSISPRSSILVFFWHFFRVSTTYIIYTRAEGMQAVLLTSSRCVVSVDNLFTFGEHSCHPSLHTVNGHNAAKQTTQYTANTEHNNVSVSSGQYSAEHLL